MFLSACAETVGLLAVLNVDIFVLTLLKTNAKVESYDFCLELGETEAMVDLLGDS